MTFVKLNGWPIKVLNTTPKDTYTHLGALANSFTGRPTKNDKTTVRSWDMDTVFLREDVADTIEALVEGRGLHFPFDFDAWSKPHGLGPDLDSGGDKPPVNYEIIQGEAGIPRFGYGFLQVKTAHTAIWDTKLVENRWTVGYWRKPLFTWEHVVVRGDGAKWLNGSRDDLLTTTELVVSNGAVGIVAGGGSVNIDDMFILPIAACFEFIEAFYLWSNSNNLPFSDMPYLTLEGDIIGSERIEVQSRMGDVSYVQHGTNSGWRNNARTVSFTLTERKEDLKEKIPRPLFSYLLDDTLEVSSALPELSGGFGDAIRTNASYTTGAYSFGRSLDFDSGADNHVDLPPEVSEAIGGANKITVLALVNRDSVGAFSTVFGLVHSNGDRKVDFRFLDTDFISVRARPVEAGTEESYASGTVTDTLGWHQVGCVVDLGDGTAASGRLKTILDGKIIGVSSGRTFDDSVFGNTSQTPGGRIARLVAGGSRFSGKIAAVGLWLGELPEGDINNHFELAKEGVFS